MIHRKAVRLGLIPLLITSLFGEVAVKHHHEKPKSQERPEDPENPHGNRTERMETQRNRSVEHMIRFNDENKRGQRNGSGGNTDPMQEAMLRTTRTSSRRPKV